MITLATLETATEQEIFDQVADHLLTQMEMSAGEEGCLYRGEKGLKCAAGCLIADDEYDKNFEFVAWEGLANDLGVVSKKHVYFIQELQEIHDNGFVENWRNALAEFAKENGLNTSVLEKYYD